MRRVLSRYAIIIGFIGLVFLPEVSMAQGSSQDLAVSNAEIVVSPAVYPYGRGIGEFYFEALDGVTLFPGEAARVTICLSKLEFDFVDSTSVGDEIFGEGAELWDTWVYDTFSTCLIGMITQDLPADSKGYIKFPIKVTGSSSMGEPIWAQNNMNINLQPHALDPSNDPNDQTAAGTHTVSPCGEDNTYVTGEIQWGSYHAAIQVASDGILDGSKRSKFYAGEEIVLEPGFEVKLNSDFVAEIKPCD